MEKESVYVKPIVQVSGIIPGSSGEDLRVKHEIVRWLRKDLPQIPDNFLDQRQNLMVKDDARVESVILAMQDGSRYLALEFSHACKQISGRTWRTEIGLATVPDHLLFASRLTSVTHGIRPAPTLSTPKIIRQVSTDFGLMSEYGHPLAGKVTAITESSPDISMAVENLVELLENRKRILPVYVLSAPANNNQMAACIVDPEGLAKMTGGIAHIYYLDNSATRELSGIVGRDFSVFNGAIRMYNPGFSYMSDNMYAHPLIIPAVVQRMGGARAVMAHLVRYAYEQNTANRELNEAIFPRFAEVRSRYYRELRLEQEAKQKKERAPTPQRTLEMESPGFAQSDVHALKALQKENSRLETVVEELKTGTQCLILKERSAHEQELNAMQIQVDEALGLAAEEEVGRKLAEGRVRSLQEQVDELANRVPKKIEAPALSKGLYPPLSLVKEWAEATFGEQLVISNRAQKAARNHGHHRDLPTIYGGLSALANEYLRMRLANNGQNQRAKDAFDRRLTNMNLENRFSINPEQAGCYGDTYYVTVGGIKYFLRDHLTKGSSRDPQTLIRIYYAYDSDNERVVVGHLPSHLENKMT